MIINKSGITIRLAVADVRITGRATQGVRFINLDKKQDEIASVTKVLAEHLEDVIIEEDADSDEGLIEGDVNSGLKDDDEGLNDNIEEKNDNL